MQQHASCKNKYIDSSSETVFNYIFWGSNSVSHGKVYIMLTFEASLQKKKSDASLSVKVLGTLEVKPHY